MRDRSSSTYEWVLVNQAQRKESRQSGTMKKCRSSFSSFSSFAKLHVQNYTQSAKLHPFPTLGVSFVGAKLHRCTSRKRSQRQQPTCTGSSAYKFIGTTSARPITTDHCTMEQITRSPRPWFGSEIQKNLNDPKEVQFLQFGSSSVYFMDWLILTSSGW